MIFLTFGTGMGAGLILNGRLYSGSNDMAGEIGHIRMVQMVPLVMGRQVRWKAFAAGAELHALLSRR